MNIPLCSIFSHISGFPEFLESVCLDELDNVLHCQQSIKDESDKEQRNVSPVMIWLNAGVESKVSVNQCIKNFGLCIIPFIIIVPSNDIISPLLGAFH